MFTELTGVAKRAGDFITCNRRGFIECVKDGGTGVAESLVPKSGRSDEVGVRSSGGGGWGQGVEVAVTIAACDHAPRPEVLDRKTQSIKFYGAIIVTRKLSNRKKVMN